MNRNTRVSAYWKLGLILLIYVILAVAYSIVTPIGRGADEWAHYWYAQFIADNGRLPTSPAEREIAGYKSDWPPLYHLAAAGLTFWIETEGPPTFKYRADNVRRQLVPAQGPEAILHTEDERFPWQQEILIWHLGRFLSIAFSLATLVVTYFTALEWFEGLGVGGKGLGRKGEKRSHLQSPISNLPITNYQLLATLTVALLAFNPRFLFTGMLFNYDSLTLLLSSLFLWLCIRIVKGYHSTWGWGGLGALAGLALVTKYLTLLLPLVMVYVAWVRVARSQGNRVAGEQGRRSAGAQEAGNQGAAGSTSTGLRTTHHALRPTRPIYHYLTQALIAYLLVITPWFAYLVINFNEIETYGPVLGTLAPLIRGDGSDRTVEGIFAWLSGGQAPEPAYIDKQNYSIGQILAELPLTFWGNPVVEPYPLNWFVGVMTLITALAVIGLILHLRITINDLRAKPSAFIIHYSLFIILVLVCLLPLPFMLVRLFGVRDALEAVQGRHILFLAGPAFAILCVYGFSTFWTVIISRRGLYNLRFAFYGLLALLLTASMAQLLFMSQAYPSLLPVRTTTALLDRVEPPPQPITLPNGAKLLGYRLLDENEQSLHVDMFWQGSDRWAVEDYQTELALVDAEGQTRMAWLGYQTQARYPTRLWEPGDRVRDEGWLPVVGLPTGEYELRLRILGAAGPVVEWQTLAEWQPTGSMQRAGMVTVWQNGQPATQPPTLAERETVQLTFMNDELQRTNDELIGPDGAVYTAESIGSMWANFIIEPYWPAGDYRLASAENSPVFRVAESRRNFDLPQISQPIEANFAGKIKLLGYDLPTRRVEPGGGLPLTLYWQGLDWMGEEFVIFNRLLDNQGSVWGGYDRLAQENYSTLLWAPGEIVTDGFAVPVAPDAPDGVYTLSIGWYRQANGQAESLPIVDPTAGEPTGETAVSIGPIKVGGPPAGVTVEPIKPQIEVQTVLGNKIELLGVDQNDRSPCSSATLEGCSLSMTFYWESLAPTEVDYTIFVHVLDQAGETVAQQDRPPLAGAYPTSLWDEGEIIKDELAIPVDNVEPGRYDLAIGLYDFATGSRLPVEGSPDGTILLKNIQIPPDLE
ncbi:MAG: glycosyltransferase family 39 protein [Anaerolineales bacterium]|nr:glycosyltransferase family 39 protein [Anaerolineales bacterium]